MNDITSWDNYSDISSEGEEDIYRSTSHTETGKQYMMKKYMNYVKEAINVNELKEIFIKCSYKDDQIKKLVDEKLSTLNIDKKKKNYENFNYASPHAQSNKDAHHYYNNSFNNNNYKFERQSNRHFQQDPNNDTLNVCNDGYSKNENSKYTYNNYSNNNGNVFTKKKFNRVTSNNDFRFGSNFNNNFRTNNEVSQKTGHETVQEKDTESSNKFNNNDFKKIDNQSYLSNAQNINNPNSAAEKSQNHSTPKFHIINKQNDKSSIQQTDIQNSLVVETLRDFGINPKIVSVTSQEKDKEGVKCESLASKNEGGLNNNICSLTPQDVKEVGDEIKIDKGNPKKQEENSIQFACDITNISEKDNEIDSPTLTKDRDIMEIMNMSLTIGPNEKQIEEKNISLNKTDSTNFDLQYDMTKIPNNFLNAKTYSDYFFNQNAGRDSSNTRQQTPNKDIYVNMNMSMNMSMNMRMNPDFPMYQGFFPMPNQMFPNQHMMPPMTHPSYMNNPYCMQYNNGNWPSKQMNPYSCPNPNMNYYPSQNKSNLNAAAKGNNTLNSKNDYMKKE